MSCNGSSTHEADGHSASDMDDDSLLLFSPSQASDLETVHVHSMYSPSSSLLLLSPTSQSAELVVSPVHASLTQTNHDREYAMEQPLFTQCTATEVSESHMVLSGSETDDSTIVISPISSPTRFSAEPESPPFSCISSVSSPDPLFLISPSDRGTRCSMPLKHSTPAPTTYSGNRLRTKRRLITELNTTDTLSGSCSSLREDTSTAMFSYCCSNRCLAHFSVIEIENVREVFESKSFVEQNQFLLDCFHITSKHCRDSTPTHTVDGKQVCKGAFLQILGISAKRYKKLYDQSHSGVMVASRKQVYRGLTVQATEAKAWMSHFFNQIGDRMPHIQQVHLPHFLTKKDVYSRMKKELSEQGILPDKIVSQSHFYGMWETYFKSVVIPEHSLFSKCDLCTKFAQERTKPGKTNAPNLQVQHSLHLQLVETERKKYYHHREKARSTPQKYLTIIIDGMDQNKTNVPSLLREAKSTQTLQRLKTHLTGAIVHTRAPHGKYIYAYYDFLQWPHDSNLTIQVFCDILVKVKERQRLQPCVLYLQLDNCGRENKNRFILGFCALLVQKKVFQKVRTQVNFLPVGHTHEDVDQFFSKVSQRLKRRGAESISALLNETRHSTTPEPHVSVIQTVVDAKEWLSPVLEPLHGHSTPHCFRFTRSESGEAMMYYKQWSSDPWCSEEQAVKLLKDYPVGLPKCVVPTDDKLDIPSLKSDIPKFRPWLSVEAWEDWERFLKSTLPALDCNDGEPQDVDQSFINVFETANDGSRDASRDTEPEITQDLVQMLASQKTHCEVYTGPYRPPNHPSKRVMAGEVSELEKGQLVAVHCDNCELEPLIGRISNTEEDEIEIVWLEGKYGKAWKTAKIQDPKNKRRKIEWKDRLPKSAVLL